MRSGKKRFFITFISIIFFLIDAMELIFSLSCRRTKSLSLYMHLYIDIYVLTVLFNYDAHDDIFYETARWRLDNKNASHTGCVKQSIARWTKATLKTDFVVGRNENCAYSWVKVGENAGILSLLTLQWIKFVILFSYFSLDH